MANGQPTTLLRQLRALLVSGTATGLTDSQLLERFTARRAESAEAVDDAESAFAALVDRHGAMVWGVCRRVLADPHEAEDAFQATFLILARKSRSVRVDGSLGRWLYGVAQRVALRARAVAKRREICPGRTPVESSSEPTDEVVRRDLRDALREEVDRLPAKYRCPIELCYLQGLTYDQAAVQLNWPVATVKSRLTRGRLRLRQSLVRRGLAPAVLAALASDIRAAVPQQLVHSTVRASIPRAAGVFPAAVTNLAEGLLKMMVWEKYKLVAAIGFVAFGLTAVALAQFGSSDRALAPRQRETDARSLEKPLRESIDSKHAAQGNRDWVRTLPNGATIEVVGVSRYPAGTDTWWHPDGMRLSKALCDPFGTQMTSDPDAHPARAILVRLTGLPPGADHRWWISQADSGPRANGAVVGYVGFKDDSRWWIDQADSGSDGQGQVKLGGKAVPGLSKTALAFADRMRNCTVRFEVAAGPWQTVRTSGKDPGAVSTGTGQSTIFGEPIAIKTGTTLSLTHNIHDAILRLVAAARDGKEHPAKIRSASGVQEFHQLVVEFKLPPERIKEFRVQTRQYEKVEIPGIALEPRASK
jgi:RNA polymerase sigma factor (sigma-70 family)